MPGDGAPWSDILKKKMLLFQHVNMTAEVAAAAQEQIFPATSIFINKVGRAEL